MLCALAKKKLYVSMLMLISLLKFSRQIPHLPRLGKFECRLKTSKGGVCLDKNWMLMDRREDGGWGGGGRGGRVQSLVFFADVINDFFFSLPLHSPLFQSFIRCFVC